MPHCTKNTIGYFSSDHLLPLSQVWFTQTFRVMGCHIFHWAKYEFCAKYFVVTSCLTISLFNLVQNKINHTVLKELLDPIKELYEDVKRKALMRLEYEGLHKSEAITTPGVRFYNDPAGYAMNRYAYYVCYKCKKVLI